MRLQPGEGDDEVVIVHRRDVQFVEPDGSAGEFPPHPLDERIEGKSLRHRRGCFRVAEIFHRHRGRVAGLERDVAKLDAFVWPRFQTDFAHTAQRQLPLSRVREVRLRSEELVTVVAWPGWSEMWRNSTRSYGRASRRTSRTRLNGNCH